MMIVSIFTITFMTLAVAGLAIGFGTLFPQFETENAAQIPTSFGGLVFMMSSIALIGLVIVLEARPVTRYLCAAGVRRAGRPARDGPWLRLAVVVCGAATLVPIARRLRRLERLEREVLLAKDVTRPDRRVVHAGLPNTGLGNPFTRLHRSSSARPWAS